MFRQQKDNPVREAGLFLREEKSPEPTQRMKLAINPPFSKVRVIGPFIVASRDVDRRITS